MRVALLISGRGSTAASIIRACQSNELQGVSPACVISSRENAEGINRMLSLGLDRSSVYVVSPKKFSSPEQFGEEILKICKANSIDFIGQYGWLVKTPANVIERYKNMMVNQHDGPLDPSPPGKTGPGRPDFGGEGMYGLRVSCARILFVRKTGHDFWTEATAQRVEPLFDRGAVLKTTRLDILENDTPETLSARLLPLEHQLQIDTLRDFAQGTVKEIWRSEPLVRPEEFEILNECKKEAIVRYPKG